MATVPAFARRLQNSSSSYRSPVRIVLALCVIGGLFVPVYFLGVAEVSHFGWDFHAYYTAAEAALHGESFVGIRTGIPGVTYVYPPIAVALFMPQAAAGGWKMAFVLQSVLNVAAAGGLAALVVRTIEAHQTRLPGLDRLLIVSFCVGSAPVMAILGQGQVDLLIALALAGAFLALERGKQELAGIALGAATLVKVFPVLLGIWLVWRRSWRAVGAAIATGLSGLALGWAWFGLDAYWRYLDVLAGRSRVAEFAGTVSPNFFAMSLYRPFSQLLPTVDPYLYAPLACLVLVPIVGLVARAGATLTDRLTTYLVAITAMLLVSPASNAVYVVYAYFPLLCLLYIGGSRRIQPLLLAGTLAIAFPVQPAQIATILTVAGVPVSISSHVIPVVSGALTVASIPLVGLLGILGWCSLYSGRHEGDPSEQVAAVHAD